MAKQGVVFEKLTTETLLVKTNFVKQEIIKAGSGVLKRGQVLAWEANYASEKKVPYVSGATNGTEKIVSVLLEDIDASVQDVTVGVLKTGEVVAASLKGMSFVDEGQTIEDPTVTTLPGGSLTAGTYAYNVNGVASSGNTVPSGSVNGTTETTNLVLKVEFEKPVTMDTVRVWRDGTAYYDVTAEELTQGFILDDGTKVWTAGTPVIATDYAGFAGMEMNGIFGHESTNGYSFRK